MNLKGFRKKWSWHHLGTLMLYAYMGCRKSQKTPHRTAKICNRHLLNTSMKFCLVHIHAPMTSLLYKNL